MLWLQQTLLRSQFYWFLTLHEDVEGQILLLRRCNVQILQKDIRWNQRTPSFMWSSAASRESKCEEGSQKRWNVTWRKPFDYLVCAHRFTSAFMCLFSSNSQITSLYISHKLASNSTRRGRVIVCLSLWVRSELSRDSGSGSGGGYLWITAAAGLINSEEKSAF